MRSMQKVRRLSFSSSPSRTPPSPPSPPSTLSPPPPPSSLPVPTRPTDPWTQRLPPILVACCCGFLPLCDYARFACLSVRHRAATRLSEAHPYRVDVDFWRSAEREFMLPPELLRLRPRALRLTMRHTLGRPLAPVPRDWLDRIVEIQAPDLDQRPAAWEQLLGEERRAFVALRRLTITRVSDVWPFGHLEPLTIPHYASLRVLSVRATVSVEFYKSLPQSLQRLSVMRVCTTRRFAHAYSNRLSFTRQEDAVERAAEHRKSRVALMNRPLPQLTHLRVPLDFGAADLRWLYLRAPRLESLHVRALLRTSIAPDRCRADVVGAADGAILRTLRHFAYDSERLVGKWTPDENGYDALKNSHTTAPTPVIAAILESGGFDVGATSSSSSISSSSSDSAGTDALGSDRNRIALQSFRFGCRLRPQDVTALRPMLQRLHTLCLANTTRTPSLRAMFGTRDAPNLPLLRKLSFRPSYRANGARYPAVALDIGLVFALPALEELDLRYCRLYDSEECTPTSDDSSPVESRRLWVRSYVGQRTQAAKPRTVQNDGELVSSTVHRLDMRTKKLPEGLYGQCLVPVGRMFPHLVELLVRYDHLLRGVDYELDKCTRLDTVYVHSNRPISPAAIPSGTFAGRVVPVNDGER